MKKLLIVLFLPILFWQSSFGSAGNEVLIIFENDYADVYHLSLFVFTPEGKSEIRVSNLNPGQRKEYRFAQGTEVYLASYQQEAIAMQGKDIRKIGAKPFLIVKETNGVIVLKAKEIARWQAAQLPASVEKPDPSAALGTWQIDLRPSPDSSPYLKEFKFTAVKGKRFDGEFYGYPFSGGFFNVDWDKLYFAFTTSDQSGVYYHSGYILGNKIFGMTLNESREFFLPWTGEKTNIK